MPIRGASGRYDVCNAYHVSMIVFPTNVHDHRACDRVCGQLSLPEALTINSEASCYASYTAPNVRLPLPDVCENGRMSGMAERDP